MKKVTLLMLVVLLFTFCGCNDSKQEYVEKQHVDGLEKRIHKLEKQNKDMIDYLLLVNDNLEKIQTNLEEEKPEKEKEEKKDTRIEVTQEEYDAIFLEGMNKMMGSRIPVDEKTFLKIEGSIKKGWTYDEVALEIGGEGSLVNEAEINGEQVSTYFWRKDILYNYYFQFKNNILVKAWEASNY